MKKATLTHAGANRIGAPQLAGKTVEVELYWSGDSKAVYYEGVRIAGCLTTSGPRRGLIIKK